MNKLDTPNGGFPFELNDFRFIQDAWREGFTSIYAHWGLTAADAVVITGLNQTDGGATFDYTDGFIFFEGEIFRFDAASIVKPGGGQAHFVVVKEINGAEGSKAMEDGPALEVHKVRTVEIENHPTGAPPADSIIFTDIDVRRVVDLALGHIIHEFDFAALKIINSVASFVHEFIPDPVKNSAKMSVRWQAHIDHDSLDTTAIIGTFKVQKEGVTIKTAVQTILKDGARHIVSILAEVPNYAAGEKIQIEGTVGVVTDINVRDSTVECLSLDAVTP